MNSLSKMSESQTSEDHHMIQHVLPCRGSNDSLSVVDIDMPVMTFWQKSEVYLKMISVPLIIVAVTFVGFLLRFFSEIIIPTILALFLFQISKVIVLWLHRPILPYLSYEVEEVPDEEKLLINSDVGFSIELLPLESPKEAGMEMGDSLSVYLFYCNSTSSSDYLPPIYYSHFSFSNCVVFVVIRFNHSWLRTTKSMLFMPKK